MRNAGASCCFVALCVLRGGMFPWADCFPYPRSSCPGRRGLVMCRQPPCAKRCFTRRGACGADTSFIIHVVSGAVSPPEFALSLSPGVGMGREGGVGRDGLTSGPCGNVFASYTHLLPRQFLTGRLALSLRPERAYSPKTPRTRLPFLPLCRISCGSHLSVA